MKGEQADLLSPVSDLGLVRHLLADLHDDLLGKVARFRQLADLSMSLGANGTMMPGGSFTQTAWAELRARFIQGHFIATVVLSQGLAEHILAAELTLGLDAEELPPKIAFQETLRRCVSKGLMSRNDADDLKRLMQLRNPLCHYRGVDDPTNLDRRVIDSRSRVETHLSSDAHFAIGMAVRLLALPAFRLDGAEPTDRS